MEKIQNISAFMSEAAELIGKTKHLKNVDLYPYRNYVELCSIVVEKDQRKNKVGSRFMEELVFLADRHNVFLALTPTTDFGATSVTRLRKFYKRFGFVRNLGRNKDFRTMNAMIRK